MSRQDDDDDVFSTGIWVTANLFKSPGYFTVFCWCNQCCSLNGLHSFSYFQVFKSLYEYFGDCTVGRYYNCYHHHFHVPQFVSYLAMSMCLAVFLLSFSFTQWLDWTFKSSIWYVLTLLLTIPKSGRMSEIRWSVCFSKSQRIFCVLFSWMDSGLCIYSLTTWSNLNFLHNSQWTILPTQSCLIL